VQDVTLTDTAGVATHAMWGKLRGEEVSLSCVFWTYLFRPWRFTGDYLLPQRPARLAHPVWSVLDAVTTRVPGFRFRTPRPKLYAEELTPRALIDAVDLFAPSLTVRPDYDEPFLDWLFAEMSEVTTYGTLVRTLLRDDDGRVRGWYVYYLLPGGTSYVLQLMADEGSVGDTIDHLLHDARSGGSAALRGRLEPRLLEPLARRRCLFRYEGGALIHTENISVLNAIAYGHSLLTRMDGEWWMGHHLEPFEPVRSSTDRTAMPTVR
jgi:hypothetical protein